jgi:hypothetical protein
MGWRRNYFPLSCITMNRMKTSHLLPLWCGAMAALAFAPVLSAATPKADFRTTVVFFEPEKFTEVSDRYNGTDQGRADILDLLKDYIQERAQSFVREGEKLSITITDVDLAGDYEPWRGAFTHDIRIVKDIYPPRISLSFKLTGADGEVIKQGTRDLKNLGFLQSIAPPVNESYRHEKALIDDWLRAEFARKKN